MCRSRLWLLYWVRTQILRMPALAMLDRAKSISRYTPPNGTAGLARSAVSGLRRVPAPPASTIPRTDALGMNPSCRGYGLTAMLPRIGRDGEELTWRSVSFPWRNGFRRGGRGRRGGLPRLADQHLQGTGHGDGQQRRDEAAEQPADQVAQLGADQHREQDQERIDPDRPAHDHRVQHVVLDLGIDQEHREGDDAGGEALAEERERDGGDTGQGPADHRQEVH